MSRQAQMSARTLRRLIRRSGLTRSEAAEELGVSRRTLQRWLAGEAMKPTYARLARFLFS